ncbi:hypothetical protein KSS87_006884 [Heliosperma pusillum]|nr:hypothetical protein KSS87_006884 [Heliosperma pusillum]KAH9606149.1 hypothetical protein KSS87_006884 [Heliosperma pusillum]
MLFLSHATTRLCLNLASWLFQSFEVLGISKPTQIEACMVKQENEAEERQGVREFPIS